VLTDITSAIAAFVLTVIAELVKLIKSKKALVFAGGLVAAFLLIVLGYSVHPIISNLGTTNPTSSGTPTSSTTGRGLDLAGYCDSYGYESNSENICYSDIDLDRACNWQYERTDLHIVMSGGPYSGDCYDAKRNFVGGIGEMPRYCSDSFQRSTSVKAVVKDGKTWVCQTTIDHDLACLWQYQSKNLVAREEDGLWKCFNA